MKRTDIKPAIDLLVDAARLLGEPASRGIQAEINSLDLLVSRIDAGAYVEIVPDSSGFRWVSIEPVFGDPNRQTRRLGFTRLADIVTHSVARWEGLPIVVSSEWGERWVSNTVRKLEAMGLTVIVED